MYCQKVSKLVYTFTLRYSLASRAFPKATISVVCTELPAGSKFHFSQWKIFFPNSFSLINT